ncbi:hypothetical protein [Vibrio alginolyticus]|uniref:hypothetical protein n=1 Tax=Vibrio alginolyticus TaxID=663 RepID=UPI001C3DA05B|nr:hypothetical protein [Vibrio alginolyticus]
MNMLDRCNNPDHASYCRYGGAGITVTKRWLFFENFVADMGYKPESLTLDRIDGSLGYSKDNCRWATAKQQAENRKTTIWITYRGDTLTFKEWCILYGQDYKVAHNRHAQQGWTYYEAIGIRKRVDGRKRIAWLK